MMVKALLRHSSIPIRLINVLESRTPIIAQNYCRSTTQIKNKLNESFVEKSYFSTSIKEGLMHSNQDQGCAGPKLTKEERLAKTQREKTPAGKLENEEGGVKHPYQEKEPLEPHPGGVNPTTGEIGGPRGPEPTRYGDWERKGRVTDF